MSTACRAPVRLPRHASASCLPNSVGKSRTGVRSHVRSPAVEAREKGLWFVMQLIGYLCEGVYVNMGVGHSVPAGVAMEMKVNSLID
jgi:hypothetical protein